MKMRWYNRNIAGVHFGGSLYAMVDPQYMVMLSQLLGKDYIVWDKAAEVDFIKPGQGTVSAKFVLSDEIIEEIKLKTANGSKTLPEFDVKVRDESGDIVAKIKKILYVRKKPARGNRKRGEFDD